MCAHHKSNRVGTVQVRHTYVVSCADPVRSVNCVYMQMQHDTACVLGVIACHRNLAALPAPTCLATEQDGAAWGQVLWPQVELTPVEAPRHRSPHVHLPAHKAAHCRLDVRDQAAKATATGDARKQAQKQLSHPGHTIHVPCACTYACMPAAGSHHTQSMTQTPSLSSAQAVLAPSPWTHCGLLQPCHSGRLYTAETHKHTCHMCSPSRPIKGSLTHHILATVLHVTWSN